MTPKMQIHWSLATLDDVHAIALMSRNEIEANLEWTYKPRQVANMLLEPNTCTVCMRYESPNDDISQLVGFGSMKLNKHTADIILLAVDRSVRRKGIGKSILEWLEHVADIAGIERLCLEVRLNNLVAQRFYRTLGYSEIGKLSNYYRGLNGKREHGLRFEKILREECETWEHRYIHCARQKELK